VPTSFMSKGVSPMKLEQVQVRIEPELREKLQAQADADMRPLASLIRKILRAAVARPGDAGARAA
jgi:predicted HicB family RNase H-like nuclease